MHISNGAKYILKNKLLKLGKTLIEKMKSHAPLVVISHNLSQRIKISCDFPDIVCIFFNKVFLQEVCNLKTKQVVYIFIFLIRISNHLDYYWIKIQAYVKHNVHHQRQETITDFTLSLLY